MTETELVTQTLIIKSRGRQYYTCVCGGHTAKLVIDGLTEDLEVDRVVTVKAVDLSKRSRYGVELKFQAVEILGDRSAAEARAAAEARREAEKWLTYAEDDARYGKDHTNAIAKAEAATKYPEFADRVAALKARVLANRAAQPEKDAQATLWRAQGHVARGLLRTRAVLQALADADAGTFPRLAGQHAELRAAIAAKATELQTAEAAQPRRTLLPRTPQLGVAVRDGQTVIVYTRVTGSRRIDDEDPSMFGHQLLGYEGQQGVLVEYRQATAEEIAALDATEHAQQQAAAAASARDAAARAIADAIKAAGEAPEGHNHVSGERLCGEPGLYGTGDWFVIDQPWIWWIHNNGHDGDDWSRNNVLTHGAGAIGWRITYTDEMAAQIRHLHDEGAHLGW